MKSFISLACLALLAAEGWCCTPAAMTNFQNCMANVANINIQSISVVETMANHMCQPVVIDGVVDCAKPLLAACKNTNPIASAFVSQFDLTKMGEALHYGCDHFLELHSQIQCIELNSNGFGSCIQKAFESNADDIMSANADDIMSAFISGRPLSPELLHGYICATGKAEDQCISESLGSCGNAASILIHILKEMRPNKCS